VELAELGDFSVGSSGNLRILLVEGLLELGHGVQI
jgi:hypothetical protein